MESLVLFAPTRIPVLHGLTASLRKAQSRCGRRAYHIWTCSLSSHTYVRHRNSRDGRRQYSASSPNGSLQEQVTVPCRSNGDITLDIFHPTRQDGPNPPVIIFLPTAPDAQITWGVNDHSIISALVAATKGTVVSLNYRLGNGVCYPTPIHDVLAGYDYVRERFAEGTSTTRLGRVKKVPLRVGVCGQLIGGSLAAMLALTESRHGEDRVLAAAINSPLVDWVFPELATPLVSFNTGAVQEAGDRADVQVAKTLRKRRKAKQLASWEAFRQSKTLPTAKFEQIRRDVFSKPANYFDPFASPIHFLRSPGVHVPRDPTLPEEDSDVDSLLKAEAAKPRKVLRNWPPTGSAQILPSMRLSFGDASPLFDQDEEFVKLLRRGVVRTAQSRAGTQALLDRFEEEIPSDNSRLELALNEAEEKIEYHLHAGASLWGTKKESEWLEDVSRAGAWLRAKLE